MKSRNKYMGLAGGILVVAGILLVNGVNSSAADNGPSQDVWLDVIKKDNAPRLSVTVPMAIAFVVNGTNGTGSQDPISVEGNSLLLPNVMVKVPENPDSGEYEIGVMGDSSLSIKNYSTIAADQDSDGNINHDPALRQGSPVKLNAYMEEKQTPDPLGASWGAVADPDQLTANEDNVKNFRISLKDSTQQEWCFQNQVSPKIWLDQEIGLEGPDESGGYEESGRAKIPYEMKLELKVEVGGVRGQYSQVEESCKAGEIIWQAEVR